MVIVCDCLSVCSPRTRNFHFRAHCLHRQKIASRPCHSHCLSALLFLFLSLPHHSLHPLPVHPPSMSLLPSPCPFTSPVIFRPFTYERLQQIRKCKRLMIPKS